MIVRQLGTHELGVEALGLESRDWFAAAAPEAPEWDGMPTDDAVMLWEAEDEVGTTLDDATLITLTNSGSGGAFSELVNPATLRHAEVNSLAALQILNTSTKYQRQAGTDVYTTITAYFVARIDEAPAQRLWGVELRDSSSAHWYTSVTGAAGFLSNYGNYGSVNSTFQPTQSVWFTAAVKITGGTQSWFVNGAAAGSGVNTGLPPSLGVNEFRFFGGISLTIHLASYAQAAFYSVAHDDADIITNQEGLKSKYGIS